MGNNESASERTSRVRFGSDQAYSQPVYSASQGESLDDEEEGGEHESSGNGEGESTTLAINASRGKFGCCYYSGREGIIYLMEDTEDSAWDLVKTRMLDVNSTSHSLKTDGISSLTQRSARANSAESSLDFSFGGSIIPRRTIDEFIPSPFSLFDRFDDFLRGSHTCQAGVPTSSRLLRWSRKECAGGIADRRRNRISGWIGRRRHRRRCVRLWEEHEASTSRRR